MSLRNDAMGEEGLFSRRENSEASESDLLRDVNCCRVIRGVCSVWNDAEGARLYCTRGASSPWYRPCDKGEHSPSMLLPSLVIAMFVETFLGLESRYLNLAERASPSMGVVEPPDSAQLHCR